MNKTLPESLEFASEMMRQLPLPNHVTVALAPAFPNLYPIHQIIQDSPIALVAQNIAGEVNGAFTGEVSAEMLQSVGVTSVILGHSERRTYFGETSEQLTKKTRMALQHNLGVVYCIGEKKEAREQGNYLNLIEDQIKETLFELTTDQISSVTIAYEPVWAIGSGQPASLVQIQEVHAHIRTLLVAKFGNQIGGAINILYGGSVTPEISSEILSLPNVNGALIGGASLNTNSLLAIAKNC